MSQSQPMQTFPYFFIDKYLFGSSIRFIHVSMIHLHISANGCLFLEIPDLVPRVAFLPVPWGRGWEITCHFWTFITTSLKYLLFPEIAVHFVRNDGHFLKCPFIFRNGCPPPGEWSSRNNFLDKSSAF